MFPAVEYQYACMWGTYWVPCEVLDNTSLGYTVKFFDDYSQEYEIHYKVPATYLKFPSFSELIV